MPPTNYTTFRVRGIPMESTCEGFQALVAQAVSCQDASEVRVRSLAVDASRPHEMVATVTFANIPEELSDSSGDWTIETPQDITLVIDTHFHGCTTLYCPPVNEWRYDLIAISGLNGHAFGSFKKKNGSYMWLRDSLPQDFPGCRVIIYGYDTRLQGSRSYQNLLDIGKKFQTAVRQVRQDARKPLILLGHSLGGIVVKEAISLMRGSSIDADKLTFAAIRGVIFFGVPNQGMDIRSLIPMVGDQANRGFLHNLDHNSPVLRIQAKEFSTAISDLRCEILNFYETQESPTAHQNEDGTWSMSGPSAVLVDTHSATHGRPDDSQRHRVYPIDCDHSSLIKFASAHDEPYATFVAFVQEIDENGETPVIAMTATQEACYQSLGFREQYHRIDSLEPSPGTCDWLITHEAFTEWLQSSKGFLWIRGKPGSGKSMAMKRALKHVKDSTSGIVAAFFIHGQGTELQKTTLGIYRSLMHQLYPYSPESFSSLTFRFKEYTEQAGKKKEDIKWSWMNGEIRQNFFEGLRKLLRESRVTILVDALDEAGEEQARAIFKDLDTLIGSLGDDSTCRLSLCLACRHYPNISSKRCNTIIIEEFNSLDIKHVVNSRLDSEDIFKDSEKCHLMAEILQGSEGIFQWTSLVTETVILMRQKGDSFQAAMGNLHRVPRGLDRLYKTLLEPQNEQEHEIKQRTRLFQWVALATEPLTPRSLQHALCIHSRMTYRSMSECERSDDFVAEDDLETKIKTLSKGLIQINKSVRSSWIEFIHQSVSDFLLRHGGLGLLSGLPGPDAIGLGHFELSMACLKYLLIDEIRDSISESSAYPESLLTLVLSDKFPVFWYAWKNWILHAVSSKEHKSGRDEEHFGAEFMEAFCWPNDRLIIQSWLPLAEIFVSPLRSWALRFRPSLISNDNVHGATPEWPCKNARLIHLLAATGMLERGVQRTMSSDLESPATPYDDSFVTPLCYALLGHQKAVVQGLIEAGVRVDYKTGLSGRSPLYLASLWGDHAVVSLLLKSGSSLRHRESNSMTALHIAAYAGNVAAMQVLINAGAAIDFQSLSWHFSGKQSRSDTWHFDGDRPIYDRGQSPLHLAASNGKVEAVRYLIGQGANLNLRSLGGRTSPLFAAIAGQSIDTVRLLLDCEADKQARDSTGNSPILKLFHSRVPPSPSSMSQTDEAKQNILDLLIQSKCDINAKNKLGETPLRLALEVYQTTYNLRFIQLLLKAGRAEIVRNEIYATRRVVHVLIALLKAGMDPNTRDDEGETAIFWVVRSRNVSSREEQRKVDGVKLLLRSGADSSIANRIGRTALSYAIRNGENRVAGILRDSGSPEGVWRQYSKFSFVTKRYDDLTGMLRRVFKRDWPGYSDIAQKVGRLLCCTTSVGYDIIESSSCSSDVPSWSDDGWSDDGWSDGGADNESPSN